MGENIAAARDRICPQPFSAATSCPHIPTPPSGAPAGPAIPVPRTLAPQSWQAGCGCLAAQTYPCVVLRANPEDGDGLDIGGCTGMCVVSTGVQPSSTLWTLAGLGVPEKEAGLLAAQSNPGKSKILPVTLKPCKCCPSDSSAALTLSSTQRGRVEPSSGCEEDRQCVAGQSPSFHHTNHTLSEGACACASAGLRFRL